MYDFSAMQVNILDLRLPPWLAIGETGRRKNTKAKYGRNKKR